MNEPQVVFLLEKLKVDDAMLRVAQTKGAISNKEMELFLAPAPNNWQDEGLDRVDQTTPTGPARCPSPPCHGRTGVDPASATQVDQFSQQSGGATRCQTTISTS